MNRPLYSYPLLLLELMAITRRPKGMLGDVWLELHERAQEAAAAECDDVTGPYRVAPPVGMH